MTFMEFKEKVLRPVYLPLAFVLGSLTLGLRTATINFDIATDVGSADRVLCCWAGDAWLRAPVADPSAAAALPALGRRRLAPAEQSGA
jgi:hypothetical protein